MEGFKISDKELAALQTKAVHEKECRDGTLWLYFMKDYAAEIRGDRTYRFEIFVRFFILIFVRFFREGSHKNSGYLMGLSAKDFAGMLQPLYIGTLEIFFIKNRLIFDIVQPRKETDMCDACEKMYPRSEITYR